MRQTGSGHLLPSCGPGSLIAEIVGAARVRFTIEDDNWQALIKAIIDTASVSGR